MFFRTYTGILEVDASGEKKMHPVYGRTSKNQCLFAGASALYFLCEKAIHRFDGGSWSTVDGEAISAETTTSSNRAPQASSVELLELITNDIDDDHARSVYADSLSEVGDPRGEFITLQLQPKQGLQQRRRIAELRKVHWKRWIEPLEDMLLKRGLSFRRGFLSRCALRTVDDDKLIPALADPLLLTLESLDLSATKLKTLVPLEALVGLEVLDLFFTEVSDLKPLAALKRLRELNLHSTPTDSIEVLGKLRNLEKLSLTGTAVSEIGALANLKSLRELYISQTDITDLGPLKKLHQLTRLEAQRTALKDLAVGQANRVDSVGPWPHDGV